MCDLPKVSLVQNCYLAVSLGLQPNNSNSPDEYAQDIYQSKKEKLVLDGGMIRLPDSDTIHEGWEDSPSSLPNIAHSGTENYSTVLKYLPIYRGFAAANSQINTAFSPRQ